ncbi:alpha/beta fold hydrolase [Pseudofulvibacter geojedonensis]|uniref:Alpha/beta fold hydrolase n=1 Tax=Pseudofulvibacter geojedonensis TaxID=1123758 RepID=A0ABW3I155_9FLAO
MSKKDLHTITIPSYTTISGNKFDNLPLSYQVFGQTIGTSPIVLVNHALTGNSNVLDWWKEVVGENRLIDINRFTILAFNIPGNGYDGFLLNDFTSFVLKDIAKLFKIGLDKLGITKLFACIGGSIGGALAWELGALSPNLIENLIPIATDWKTTDWLKANLTVQELILNNSTNPVHDARIHAMNLYRTPASYKTKFNRTYNEETEIANVDSWLFHHGNKLSERFELKAYKLVNYLLGTVDITRNGETFLEIASRIKGNIIIVGIDTDLFFLANENRETYEELSTRKPNVQYHEIQSIHGHDAFLIEYSQLNSILKNIFTKELQKK